MKRKLEHQIGKMCDDVMAGRETKVEAVNRRVWAQNFAFISASSAVLWACGTSDDDNADAADVYTLEDKKSDANTMNIALGLEHEAIVLYTAAAGLGVWGTDASALAPTFLAIAKEFAAHHIAHRDSLVAQLNTLKTETAIEPVAAPTDATVLGHYPGIAALAGKDGLLMVLQVAAEREMNAANAYYSVIPLFKNKALVQTLGGYSADEAAHYGVLNAAAMAHGALSGAAGSLLTEKNVVGGTIPPFNGGTYPRAVRTP